MSVFVFFSEGRKICEKPDSKIAGGGREWWVEGDFHRMTWNRITQP